MIAGTFNNRDAFGSAGIIEICYLVDDAANICSPTFNVWIPSIMGSIDQSKKEHDVDHSLGGTGLNKKNELDRSKMKMAGSIVGVNATLFMHQLNGWIPQFKAKRMTMERGTAEHYEGSLSGPTTTESGGMGWGSFDPHNHQTTGTHTYDGVSMRTMEYHNIVMFGNTEVDFQNINNKVIKKGHMLLGCFPAGMQNQFFILAIPGVSPQIAGKEHRQNADLPDKSLDGDLRPQNSAIE